MSSPSLGRALKAIAALCLALAFTTAPAHAGSYEVGACFGSENAWVPMNTNAHITAYAVCPADLQATNNANTGILARNVGGTGSTPFMTSAWMNFGTPDGTYVSRIRGRIHLAGEIGGWVDGLFDRDGNRWVYGGPGTYTPSGYVAFDLGGMRTRNLAALSRCEQASGCPRNDQYGLISLATVTVTVSDEAAPGIANPRAEVWSTDGWLRGREYGLSFDATDAAGIKRLYPEVRTSSGVEPGAIANQSCNYSLPAPCPSTAAWYGNINAASVPDGVHVLRLVAEDAGGNYGFIDKTIRVDHTDPPQPAGLTVGGGSAWRTYDNRLVTFNPINENGAQSGLTQIHRACRAGTADCREWESRYYAGSTTHQHPTGLAFAGPGEYELSMRLRDDAGNIGPSSDTVTMRFDDQRPGPADPAKANGWLNAAEAAGYDQFVKLEDLLAEPISKIGGYSLTTDGSDPDETIDSAGDSRGVLFRINSLSEGVTTIKARAVTNAGLGSQVVKSTDVRVDKSPPSVAVEAAPAPSQWSPEAVTVPLRGTDQAHLSGMTPAPADRPATEGAYIEYRLNDAEPVRIRGDVASVQAGNGEHVLTFKAVDVAGNESEIKTIRFKVDSVVPGVAAPAQHDGWLSAEEADAFRQDLRLADESAHGPSGIAGYSVTTDGTEPDGSIDVTGEAMAFAAIPEGITTIKARAVSGAGKAGPAGSAEVKVDRSAPEVSLPQGSPDPQTWQRSTVHLAIGASDQANLSGVDGIYTRVNGAPPARTAGSSTTISVPDDGRHTITYNARDAAGNESPEKTVAFRIDGTVPETAAFEAPDLAQPLRVTAAVADRTSGVVSGTIEMRRAAGGDWIKLAARPGAESTRLTPASGRLTAWIPDASLPEGTYEFRMRVLDGAGNERMSDRAVDGSKFERTAPFRLGSQITAGIVAAAGKKVRLRACRSGRTVALRRKAKLCRRTNVRRKRLAKKGEILVTEHTITFGKTGLVRGRLVDAAGRPVANTQIRVRSTLRATGAAPSDAGAARTDADGRFTFRAPRGPSRTLHLEYEGDQTRAPIATTVALKVRARTTVRAARRLLRNGQKLRISGKLLGGVIPARGKVVELQAIVGTRWQTVATVRSNANGAWTFSYRFQRTLRPTSYRFRARMRREAAYPFELGHSKDLLVRVRP